MTISAVGVYIREKEAILEIDKSFRKEPEV